MLLSAAVCFAAPETPDEVLQHADQIRTTNNARFQALLQQLDAQAGRLSPLQRDWLAYFKGWQSGLQGDYPAAVTALTSVLARTTDPTLRARARISLLNDQFNAAQYEDAYANLGLLLDSLPQIGDRNAHFLSLTVAADLYNQAGQYDLAERFTEQALAYDRSDTSICYALYNQATTLYKTGKLRADDTQIRSGLDACERIGDPIYANAIRVPLAQAQMEHGDAAAALQSLMAHDAEVQATHSSALISLFRATLAKCYLLTGDLVHAGEYARSAVDYANKQVNSKASADAWQVLYQVAKQQRDDTAALGYLEKFAVADKGYLNDTSARALAYQMVRQQVQEKKAQIDALSQQNQVLQLKQTVGRKNMIAVQLGIALLLVILGSIVTYAYRTKRSQLKFQRLARRDGLTEIYNRQYFVEACEQELEYCRKSVRDVSVVAIDLDHFKQINDSYGHAAGDFALKRAVVACQ
ncbi:MAG TPA: GGDEF domain-containing protein, partial [Xanthomonadaceae bacterium]|nr:GGDEF domain-containing protein [Xanthomonadaceae bacterium]